MRKRDHWRLAGLCSGCGRVPDTDGSTCGGCRAKSQGWRQRRGARASNLSQTNRCSCGEPCLVGRHGCPDCLPLACE